MLHKTPKPAIWKFIKGSAKVLFIVEAVCFAASYGVWHRMNTNREFRSYISQNFPYALDYYYKIGEIFGDDSQRKLDESVWKQIEAKKVEIHDEKRV